MSQKTSSARKREPARASEQRQARLALEVTLKTEITDIFKQIVPELRPLPREAAYERIIGTPQLLDSCFQIFRLNPQFFGSVLVDRKRRAVGDPDVPLTCGATLNQAIAFIVRASARRYFRRKLDPPRRRKQTEPAAAAGLWSRLLLWRRDTRSKNPLSAAERLYRAMRGYLLYEWQVRLIPHYAPLPLGVVMRLGPRILDYRDPAQLAALARGELPEPTPLATPAPANEPAGEPASILGRDLSSLDPAACWSLWTHMGARALFPGINEPELRRAVEVAATANADLVAGLFHMVGLEPRQVLLFLVAAELRLGEVRYQEVLGAQGQLPVINRLGSTLNFIGAAALDDPPDFLRSCDVALETVFGPRV